MINWNFLPYQGYVDANNHFLNSFLGGAFIRLFQSDHILITRLPNLLALLIFGISAISLKQYIRSPLVHISLTIALLFSPYLIEFFSLARGYGLSWAFLLAGISLQISYYKKPSLLTLVACGLSLLFAAFANLALIVVSAFGMLLFLIKGIRKPLHLLVTLAFLSVLAYLINYSFNLQDIGKLYLGEFDGFLETTLLPLLEFNFSTANVLLLSTILFVGIFLLLWLPFKLLQNRSLLPNHKLIPHAYFFVAVASIFILNVLFDIRYPMHRAAAHLIVLFTVALFFTMDQMELNKGAGLLGFLLLVNFGLQANLSHTKEWSYEHFDQALLEKIPETVNGIPPTTGGRFWQIDNEMARTFNYPMRAFQDMSTMKDSLHDFIIVLPNLNPYINKTHQLIHRDPISSLSLYQRLEKVEKVLDSSMQLTVDMSSDSEFYNLFKSVQSGPMIIQTIGKLEDLDLYRDFNLIFSASEVDRDEKIQYGGISPVSSTKIKQDGSVEFNFSYLIEGREQPYQITYYLWKKDKKNLKGEIQLKVFKIL